MSEQTQTTTIDAEAILATVPAEFRAQGGMYLAAYAAATSEQERNRIRDEVVTKTLEVARQGSWCTAAEAALTAAFGEPAGGRWLMADGFDRNGYDRDGRDREGWDRGGYDRDGFNRDGWSREGF